MAFLNYVMMLCFSLTDLLCTDMVANHICTILLCVIENTWSYAWVTRLVVLLHFTFTNYAMFVILSMVHVLKYGLTTFEGPVATLITLLEVYEAFNDKKKGVIVVLLCCLWLLPLLFILLCFIFLCFWCVFRNSIFWIFTIVNICFLCKKSWNPPQQLCSRVVQLFRNITQQLMCCCPFKTK